MNHKKFILSPISEILDDVASASLGIGVGIETHPLRDYVMQSVFLKMTGAQEQKMKCICWEIATYDYEYRYSKFSQNQIGECSTYKDKAEIYKDLIKQVNKVAPSNIESINKEEVLQKTSNSINEAFSNSTLSVWAQKSHNEYTEIWSKVSTKHFATGEKNLLAIRDNLSQADLKIKTLKEIYDDHLYKQRNRIAHNTLSYQHNLPTLNTLFHQDYIYENYFIYFSILILIDNIFIESYKSYLKYSNNY